jgi:hypothetical protein
MLRILAVVGAAIVVFVGVGAYLVASAVGSASSAAADAATALQNIATDTLSIDHALRPPTSPTISGSAQHPDFKADKQTADDYAARVEQISRIVTRDIAALRTMNDGLRAQSRNPLAFSVRPRVERAMSRASSMQSAFDAANVALGIERDEARLVSALLDVFDGVNTVFDRTGSSDVAGSLQAIPAAQTKLQSAAQVAQNPNDPPQVRQLITELQTLLTDLQAGLQAVQRRDFNALQSASSRVDADFNALDAWDAKAADAFEQSRLQPHIDRYHAGLTAAGFPT